MLNIISQKQNNKINFLEWPIRTAAGRKLVMDTYERGKWGGIFPGSINEQFERKFELYNGSKYCATVSSGTSALIVALQALGIKNGDEVIVPAMSFIATATAVSYIGAIPVFVDINEFNHCISLDAIKFAITKRTKAIIVVHIGGAVCDMLPIVELARKYDIYVIEDCAQAIGAEWNKVKVGNFGDIGAFSFAQTKNLVSGEGGAITTNNKELFRKAKKIRNHGREDGMKYYHDSLGVNYRLSEIQAALLLPQIDSLDEYLCKKNYFAKMLTDEIKRLDYQWLSVMEIDDNVNLHGYFSFVFLYHKEHFDNIPKNIICDTMISEGIPVGKAETTPHTINDNPIYSQSNIENYCRNIQYNTDVARERYQEMIVLGQAVGSAVMLEGKEAVQYIVDKIEKINRNRKELKIYTELFDSKCSKIL